MTRLLSVVVHHGYDCLQSDPVMVWRQLLLTTPDPFHGELSFLHFPFVWAVSKIYTRSPSWNCLIILALEPRLRRAQSGSCHLVSLGGLFPEVCQVLS